MKIFQKKATKYLLSVLIVYALLVAPHEGEFWPFSIYPMFSKAGQPWTRALVRNMTSTPDSTIWHITTIANLQGQPISLQDFGVDQIDYANFVSKTEDWTSKRKLALQQMFGRENLAHRQLMVVKVQGQFEKGDSITVQAMPMFLVTADTVYSNPNFDQ